MEQVRKDYQRWRQLVNMSSSTLEKFLDTKEGREAGLTRKEAKKAGGIKTGRSSAHAILRMRAKPFSEWTSADVNWMYRQISFISRMSGMQGPLYKEDKNGKRIPTRKLTSLWVWGNIPDGHSPGKYGVFKMKVKEISEAVTPGEYVYHASYMPNLKSGLMNIQKHGLQPSKSGQMGAGVYFAYKPDDTYYHVSKDEATMFRVKWDDLVKLYGTYPSNKNGIQRDEEQIVVPGAVPSKFLEVEYFPDEYWEIHHALAAESKIE